MSETIQKIKGAVFEPYSQENLRAISREIWFWKILSILSGIAGMAPNIINFLTKAGIIDGINLHLPKAVEGWPPVVVGAIAAIIFYGMAYHAEQKP